MTPVAFIPLIIVTFLILLVPNRKVNYFMDTNIGPVEYTEEWSVISGLGLKVAYLATIAILTLLTIYLPWPPVIDNDLKWNSYLVAYIWVSSRHVWGCVKIK